jgi:hypothetical protein
MTLQRREQPTTTKIKKTQGENTPTVVATKKLKMSVEDTICLDPWPLTLTC